MRIPISFDTILSRYPAQKEEVRILIRKSRSKFKLAPLDSFEWSFETAVWATYSEPMSRAIEDRVLEIAQRTEVWIQARQGSKGFWNSSLIDVPKEVLDYFRESLASQEI